MAKPKTATKASLTPNARSMMLPGFERPKARQLGFVRVAIVESSEWPRDRDLGGISGPVVREFVKELAFDERGLSLALASHVSLSFAEAFGDAERQVIGWAILRRAVPDAVRALLDTALALPADGNRLAAIGEAASRAARAAVLLAVLERVGWNISHAGEVIGVPAPANVKRMLRELGLEPHYQRARAAGLVRTGKRERADVAAMPASSPRPKRKKPRR